MPTSKRLKIIRTYKSITRTLGEVGGVNSVLFMLFYYATVIYCRYKTRNIMVDKVFPFIKEAEEMQIIKSKSKGDGRKASMNAIQPDNQERQHIKRDASAKKLRKTAYQAIEDTLDVVTIV